MIDRGLACAPLLLALALAAAAPPARAQSPESEARDVAPRTEADRRILAEAGAIEQEVARLRGRPFRAPVAKQVYSREQLAGFLEAELADPDAAEELRREELFLRAIGFLPPDLSLGGLYRDMLASQVAGFYDPEDRILRCISSELAFLQRLTLVHEIYHSLQDQHAPLKAFLEEGGEAAKRTDARRARQALVEGDAQFFTMSVYLPQHREALAGDLAGESPGELLGFGLGQALAQAAIPPFFVEQLSWPYLAGAQFVQALHAAGGFAAVDRAFEEPPASTEQILHPRKHLDRADPPRSVRAPRPAFARGFRELLRDTRGEAEIAELLRHLGHDPVHAARGSEGWGGDEVLVLEDPAGGELLVWLTRWDSERDAEQSFGAWRRVLVRQHEARDGEPAPLLAERARGAAAFAPIARGAPPLPDEWSRVELPAGCAACAAGRAGAPASWLLQRGRDVVLLRGAALPLPPSPELAALARALGTI